MKNLSNVIRSRASRFVSLRVVLILSAVMVFAGFGAASAWNGGIDWLSIRKASAEKAPVNKSQNAKSATTAIIPLDTRTVCNSGTPDFASVALAVADANAAVPAGGRTYLVCAGLTETAPAGGYSITATGASAANPVVFVKDGAGVNPTITASAALTVGALNDGIVKIIGADNITIDGFTMLENAANTTTAAATNNMTEWGVALLYASTTNGAQNITIQNSTIDLNRTYQNTFGIYSNSTHTATAVTTSATATTTAGGNSGMKVYGNNVTDVNQGIVVVGPTAAADNNDGIDIGGASGATANTITNYGTTGTFSGYANVSGTVYGILVRNSKNLNISFNNITSSSGASGVTVGTLRGIYVPSASNQPTGTFTNNINSNTLAVTSHVLLGTINGISVESTTSSPTSTTNINNNNFSALNHTIAGATGAITAISQSGSDTAGPLVTSVSSNTFTSITSSSTGSFTFISNSWTMPTNGTKNVNSNSTAGVFSRTGASGLVTCFTDNGVDTAGSTNNFNSNSFTNFILAGASSLTCISSTNGGAPTKNVNNNTVSSISGSSGAIIGITTSFDGGPTTVSGNTVSNLNGSGAITGMSHGSGTFFRSVTQNNVNTLTGSGTGAVTGILNNGGTVATQGISRNKVYDLSNTNAGGSTFGVTVSAGTTVNVQNNLIGNLTASAASGNDVIRGINITSITTVSTINVSFNTVYLNATSSGANFGTSALFHTTNGTATSATLNLRNNILVNLSTANGTGLTVAYRRSSTALANYGAPSNNNDYYAGTPGGTRLIFNDGTDSDQTLAAYKARVASRDSASISENPPFLSTTGSSAQFLHIDSVTPTQLESGGIPVAGITVDYDNDPRNALTPDIGADEFTGTLLDLDAPIITYAPLGNTSFTTNRVLTVTITDATVVASGGLSPRIYFKKSTDGSYVSTQCVMTGGTPQNGTYNCTIDYTLVGGGSVAIGDVIQYFVVAQDTAGNVGSNPSAGFSATDVNNVTSPPTTPNSYTIVTAFASTVNVGAGETYTSLTNPGGLFEAMNASVLTGDTTVNITSDLAGETGTVPLNQLSEDGAGNYIVTIKPSGAARTITGSNSPGLIKLNGADRVTIDGSLSGGTDRSLTINNTGFGTIICKLVVIDRFRIF